MSRRSAKAVPGRVSVITLNFNGGDDTLACLAAMRELEDPGGGIETIVVDNASTDGSRERIAAEHGGEVTLVANATNLGFAGGCNAGVDAASGEYVAFINNDARPDPRWLTEAVAVLRQRGDCACVASKVLSWDGDRIDFTGEGGVTFYGFGYREGFGEPYRPQPEAVRETLFGTGSALVARADAYRQAGGFDDRFFAFFEDVDLGWRLWLLGHRVLYVPASVVYHRHHATMKRQGQWREDFLLERNALMSMIKNLDDQHLMRAMPAALMLSAHRGVLHGGDDSRHLDLAAGLDDDDPKISIDKRSAAALFAIDQVARSLPQLLAERERIQSARVRGDQEIFQLVRHPMLASSNRPEFHNALALLSRLFGVEQAFGPRRRIAVVTGDPLNARLSGPGIRALEIARVLASEHDVRLASTEGADLGVPGITVCDARTRSEVRALERWCDILIFQGFLLNAHPWLADSEKTIVVDLYDPFHLEQLEAERERAPEERAEMMRRTTAALGDQIDRGDFFLCASSKQRDFWLGQLTGAGRINPLTYDNDPTLKSLIDTVPFGIPEEAPVASRAVLRGVVDGIGPDDKIVLWGGGLYPWFDPDALVHAVDRARHDVPNLRLVFLAGAHPNPSVPPMKVAARTRALAQRLGLLGRHVFMIDHWVEYDDRKNYLLEADLGVSTHLDHIETAFSFRTRILDYIWARLPIVASDGDALGELIKAEGLGRAVPPGDVEALAAALSDLLNDDAGRDSCRERIDRIAPEFTWRSVTAPLAGFCRRSHRAADLAGASAADVPERPELNGGGRLRNVRHYAPLTLRYLRSEGLASTARRAARRLQRRR